MNRQAQAVVLLLLGGAVVKASVTDMYLRYVKEGLRPFLIVAGLLLIAAAVMTLWYDFRAPAADEHDKHDGHDGHDDPDGLRRDLDPRSDARGAGARPRGGPRGDLPQRRRRR